MSEECRGGGIITGERELPAGEISPTGEEDDEEENESDRLLSGAKNPTCRTFGSITARAPRRGGGGSMDYNGRIERKN